MDVPRAGRRLIGVAGERLARWPWPMSRLPLALVGSGAMGRRHLRGLAALDDVGLLEFDLVAVCDLDAATRQREAPTTPRRSSAAGRPS